MEDFIKKQLLRLIQFKLFWTLIKPFAMMGAFLVNAKNEQLQKSQQTNTRLFNDLTVKNGPFTGMQYPNELAIGSAFYPKIIGCYEHELWEVFEWFKDQKYDCIVDVGCAEGYYAVGLAINHLNSKVIACDTDKNAQQAVLQMAALNQLHNVTVQGTFDQYQLEKMDFQTRSLVICDCEGYERELFTKESVANLKNVDVLIELHDFLDPMISSTIHSLFAPTHHLLTIFSIDDLQKLDLYDFPELKKYDRNTIYQIVREGRPTRMEWLLALPISSTSLQQLESLESKIKQRFNEHIQVKLVNHE